jgi:hypothetical protein
MIVHPDEAGDDGVAMEVETLGGVGNVGGGGVGNRLDPSARDDDCLIRLCGRASSIDDADVLERNDWSVYLDEFLDVRG